MNADVKLGQKATHIRREGYVIDIEPPTIKQEYQVVRDSNTALLEACKRFASIDRTQEAGGEIKITVHVEVKAGRQAMSSNMRAYHLLEGKLMEDFPNVRFDFHYTQTDDLGSHRAGYLC
jgi:hypothetical protein